MINQSINQKRIKVTKVTNVTARPLIVRSVIKTSQMLIRASVRPCGVNILKTPRLRETARLMMSMKLGLCILWSGEQTSSKQDFEF